MKQCNSQKAARAEEEKRSQRTKQRGKGELKGAGADGVQDWHVRVGDAVLVEVVHVGQAKNNRRQEDGLDGRDAGEDKQWHGSRAEEGFFSGGALYTVSESTSMQRGGISTYNYDVAPGSPVSPDDRNCAAINKRPPLAIDDKRFEKWSGKKHRVECNCPGGLTKTNRPVSHKRQGIRAAPRRSPRNNQIASNIAQNGGKGHGNNAAANDLWTVSTKCRRRASCS